MTTAPLPSRASSPSTRVLAAAAELRDAVNYLGFSEPVTHVYNPLDYAWACHETYVTRFAGSTKRIVLLGMNPGPFGMTQTGVPFGEIDVTRSWLGIEGAVGKPDFEHPKRRVDGFACTRSEVSGRRLWGFFAERFGTAQRFFADHYVVNYCPLVFLEDSGRNRTPDKLPAAETRPLYEACDRHLREVVAALAPTWLIGIGAFAEGRLRDVVYDPAAHRIGRILHPSPASPAANRDWAGAVASQMSAMGAW